MYHDNKHAILLEVNGKRSTGKRKQALNICHFLLQIKLLNKERKIKYFPKDDVWGDFITKPTQGTKFRRFRNYVLGGNE